jgi:thioredoxin 1
VDFWAEWCGPCRVQSPIIDRLAEKYAGNSKVKFVKLNVDDNPTTQSEYHVMSIPTLIYFKKGQIADTFVGLRSEDDIEGKLKELIE